jgi:hypothetical protein
MVIAMRMSGLLLTVLFVFSIACHAKASSPEKLDTPVAQTQQNQINPKAEDTKYEGYTIDGFATASKLAAQRSHTVAGKDERDFAIFTGLVVIFIIIFFSKIQFFDKE